MRRIGNALHSSRMTFAMFYELLSPFRKSLAFALVLLFLVSVLDTLSIASLFPLLTFLVPEGAGQSAYGFGDFSAFGRFIPFSLTFGAASILAGLLFTLKAAFRLLSRWFVTHLQNLIENRLIKESVNGLLESRVSFQQTTHQGLYAQILSSEIPKVGSLVLIFADLIVGVATLLLYLYVLFSISTLLCLFALLGGTLLIIPVHLFMNRVFASGGQYVHDMHALVAYTLDVKNGFKFLKSLGRNNSFVRSRFNELIRILAQSRFTSRYLGNSMSIWVEPFGLIILLALLGFGFQKFHLGLAELLIFLLVYSRFISVANYLLSRVGDAIPQLPSLIFVKNHIRGCQQEKERSGGIRLQKYPVLISFTNISAAIGSKCIFQGLSGTIMENEFVCVCGPSGAGKTTLLDILLGFLEPTSGSIAINNTPLSQIDLREWRSIISYIPQESSLFNDTLLRNICMRLDKEDSQVALSALKRVGALHLAQRENALHEIVHENGSNYSGGERQRLSFARALTPQSRIFIFDEPFNALDENSERSFMNLLNCLKGEVTVILVTHRSDLLSVANKVITIEQGYATISVKTHQLSVRSDLI